MLSVAPQQSSFGGITISTSGMGRRTVTVNPDFTVRSGGMMGTPPSRGVIDARQGAALVSSVTEFLASNPPTVQGDPSVVQADGSASRIDITWDGEVRTFTAYFPSDTPHSPETVALLKAVMEAGNAAFR